MTAAATAATQARSTRNTDSPSPADHAGAQVDALFTALYADLCRLARREVRHNGARDVLGTRTLVHEAWLDISQQPSLAFEDAGKFLAYASRTMRGLVIDRVRARHAQKRGGAFVITSLDTQDAEQVAQPQFLADVGDALDELSALQPELARVVELKFFCGFGLAEVAAITGVCERTVQRQWQMARMLLYRALNER
jgi:RNA polymerase sigma factor (TIGR02999 family)